MTYDGSNRKDVRKAEKAAEQALARRRNFLRQIMLSMDGREWMHELLKSCNVFHTPFIAGAPDATAYNCGQQNLGLQTFADVLHVAPSEYVLMMQEAIARETINDRRYSGSEPIAAEPAGRGEDSGRNDQGHVAGTAEDADADGWTN